MLVSLGAVHLAAGGADGFDEAEVDLVARREHLQPARANDLDQRRIDLVHVDRHHHQVDRLGTTRAPRAGDLVQELGQLDELRQPVGSLKRRRFGPLLGSSRVRLFLGALSRASGARLQVMAEVPHAELHLAVGRLRQKPHLIRSFFVGAGLEAENFTSLRNAQ